jgi:hypothetical protein
LFVLASGDQLPNKRRKGGQSVAVARLPLWVPSKFAEKVCAAFSVMPLKTRIQESLKFLDAGSRYPGL